MASSDGRSLSFLGLGELGWKNPCLAHPTACVCLGELFLHRDCSHQPARAKSRLYCLYAADAYVRDPDLALLGMVYVAVARGRWQHRA